MIKVGCCGYPVSQTKYCEVFSLVELNSTFYKYPNYSTAGKWRAKAPKNFEFTVKAHQDVSHKYKLRLEYCREPFEKIKRVCRILNAKVILIQTPASLSINELEIAEEFFREIKREDFTLVWETRGPAWESEDGLKKLRRVLSEINVTHVTDPFRLMPAFASSLAYFRLHGLGGRMYYYQYTNDELRRLYEVITRFESLEMGVYVLFNNLSMFEDAKRFAFFLENKCFPPLAETFGLDSIKSTLSKVRYPVNKSSLIDKIGWRLIELEEGKQIRLNELLAAIPAKTYNGPDEIVAFLRTKSNVQ